MPKLDADTLEAALIGYEHQYRQVVEKIAEIQRELGGKFAAGRNTAATRQKRELSAAARKRIGEVQKARWAKYRREHKKEKAKTGRRKRTLTPEGRERIAAAQRARWAAAREAT